MGLIVCLTLEECEDSKPCEGTVAGDLEHDKDCYQGYGRLKQFTTFMHRMFAFCCCLEVVRLMYKLIKSGDRVCLQVCVHDAVMHKAITY